MEGGGGGWRGFPSVRTAAVQRVKSAEPRSAAETLSAVSFTAGINVFSPSRQTCSPHAAWFLSVISSP